MNIKNWKNYLRYIKIKFRIFYNQFMENFAGFFNFLRISRLSESDKTVLLVEFNAWHGETLPGYVKYFQDLGFSVVVVTKRALYKENPFCRMEIKPLHVYMNIGRMKQLLTSRVIEKFSYCLITSDPIWFNNERKWVRVVDYLGMLPDTKSKCGIIMHEAEDSEINPAPVHPDWSMEKLLQQTFVLTPLTYRGVDIEMLNPHYFGKTSRSNYKKDGIVRFITVGSIKTAKRNFSELAAALSGLHGNWELKIVGAVDNPDCLKALPPQVKILGRLDFADMYREIENSDFLLPLLDPEMDAHKHYLHSCTSGSRQLILGFQVVPVIHRDFGIHYNFSEKNAVFYGEISLADAIEKAMQLSFDEYMRMADELQKEAQRVYDISLQNLQKRLDSNE